MRNADGHGRRAVLAGLGTGLLSVWVCSGRVGGQSDEVAVTLDNQGTQAWVLQDADADVGSTDAPNPELTLTVGTRYRFGNLGWSVHPLAFRDETNTPLLTQDGQGTFEDDSEVDWVDEGEELAFTLTDELAAELDDYLCTVHPSMEGALRAVDTTAASVDMNDLSPSAALVTQGDIVAVSVTVENLTDAERTQSVTLSVGDTEKSVTVTLGGGNLQIIDFTLDTADFDPGEYTHTVSGGGDSVSGTLTVEAPPAEFQLTGLDPPEVTVRQGNEASVDVTVQNAADTEGTQTVTLELPGRGVVDSDELSLDGGEAGTVSLTADTVSLSSGEYTYTVRSEDDESSGTLTVEPSPRLSGFELADLSPTEVTTTPDEIVPVKIVAQNPAGTDTTQTVALELSDHGTVDGNIVSVDGGESKTVTLSLATVDLDPGEYTYTVVSEDNTVSGTLTVGAPPTLEIREVNRVETITEGENLVVDATVRNVGDLKGSLVVFLELSTLGQADSESLTLAGGESASVTLVAPGDLLEPGELTYTVSSSADEVSVGLTVEPAQGDDGGDGSEGDDENSADGGGPGFGPIAGVAAVGGLASYAYRRLGVDAEDGEDDN